MGGPCDTAFHAETSTDMMTQGGNHVNDEATKGDEDHKGVKTQMDAAMTDEAAAKAWGDKFEADFAALPVDQT